MAQCDRDAELDQALRELGDELLTQEIPERLLRVIRAAAGDQDERQEAGLARRREDARANRRK